MGEARRWQDVVTDLLKKVLGIQMAIAQSIDMVVEFQLQEMAEDSVADTGLLQELVE